MKQADIFVALASPNYLASRYCFETEYGFALRKAAREKLFEIVVLLRQCQWRHTRLTCRLTTIMCFATCGCDRFRPGSVL